MVCSDVSVVTSARQQLRFLMNISTRTWVTLTLVKRLRKSWLSNVALLCLRSVHHDTCFTVSHNTCVSVSPWLVCFTTFYIHYDTCRYLTMICVTVSPQHKMSLFHEDTCLSRHMSVSEHNTCHCLTMMHVTVSLWYASLSQDQHLSLYHYDTCHCITMTFVSHVRLSSWAKINVAMLHVSPRRCRDMS